MTSTGSEPAPIDPRFQAILDAPLPDPEQMTSVQRIERINLLKDMIKVMKVPEEHIRFGVTLITIDRAKAATEARKSSAEAKKAGKAPAKPVSLDDL